VGILRSLELWVLLVQAKRTIKNLFKYFCLGCPNAEIRKLLNEHNIEFDEKYLL